MNNLLCYFPKILLFFSIVLCLFSFKVIAQDSINSQDYANEDFSPYFEDDALFNPTTIQDPIYIELYNSKNKKLWSPPLVNTKLKTSGFGVRWGTFHHGIDLGLRTGTPVFAVFDGIIKLSTWYGGYGNCVIIKHDNGLETLYGHMSRLKVKVGQRIKAGQQVGLGGSTGYSTGPHLHFEVRYKGYSINPILIYDFQQKNQIRGREFLIKPHHFQHFGNRTPKRNYLYHEVGQRETLESISLKYKVSAQKIAKLNGLQNADLRAGQILRIE